MDQVTSFSFDLPQILSFFAVLIRTSVLVAIVPFFGDRVIPTPVKILFSFSLAVILFPALVSRGFIHPEEALVWGGSVFGIASAIASETLFALLIGFAARFAFDAIQFGGSLIGTYMGFAAANQFDPHQESHTQLIAQFHFTIAMLLFITLDGHHLFIQALLESFHIVGVTKANLSGAGIAGHLVKMGGEIIVTGALLSAPMAICIFLINVVFGVLGKAMPQMNVLVLSFGVSSLIGFSMMFLGMPAFEAATRDAFAHAPEHLLTLMRLAGGR